MRLPGRWRRPRRSTAAVRGQRFGREKAGSSLARAQRDGRRNFDPLADAADISDVTGATYTFLMNGLSPDENWRGLFRSGERVRLRFINASAATYFDVRIPADMGMKHVNMTDMEEKGGRGANTVTEPETPWSPKRSSRPRAVDTWYWASKGSLPT